MLFIFLPIVVRVENVPRNVDEVLVVDDLVAKYAVQWNVVEDLAFDDCVAKDAMDAVQRIVNGDMDVDGLVARDAKDAVQRNVDVDLVYDDSTNDVNPHYLSSEQMYYSWQNPFSTTVINPWHFEWPDKKK